MTDCNVIRLDHSAPPVAAAIHAVMMAAYRVEAGIIGVADFRPLRRTVAEVAGSTGRFVGIAAEAQGRLVAVAELAARGPGRIHIGALVVDPAYFRRGLGTAVLRHVVASHALEDVTVSTAAANRPALFLYAGVGFEERRRWTTEDGIAMVTLGRTGGSAER